MRRASQLLGILALVVLLWTGGPARAAEGYIPIAAAAEGAGHFAGDKDEVPSDQHQGIPHHHFACGEHPAAAWSDAPATAVLLPVAAHGLGRPDSILSGLEPDTQIRPPIA